jgi:hypothetical protein
MSKSKSNGFIGGDKGLKPSAPPPSPKPIKVPAKHGHQPSSPPPIRRPSPKK